MWLDVIIKIDISNLENVVHLNESKHKLLNVTLNHLPHLLSDLDY